MATLEPAEDFSGGANNAQVSTSTTNFDAMSAAGTPANLIHTSEWALTGLTRSMKGSGAGYQYGRVQTASHTRHRRRFSYKVGTLPPAGTNRIIYECNVGSNASIAFQVRLNDTGVIVIRNVLVAVDTSALVLSAGETVDIEIDANGAGDLTVYLFQGDEDDDATGQYRLAATAAPNETLSGALTATNFAESHIGNVTNTTGGHEHYFGYLSNLTDSEIPTPYPVPAPPAPGDFGNMKLSRLEEGVDVEYELLRRTAGTGVLYALDRKAPTTPPGGSISLILEPNEGCWFGAETPIEMGTGSTLTGLQQWEAIAGRTPDFLHFYHTGAWNGGISAAQQAQRVRPGKPTPIMFQNWKPTGTWGAIAGGSANSQIDGVAAGLRNRTDRHFLTIWHEPEDNVTGNNGNQGTEAEFVAMFEHVVTRLRAQGVAPASEGGKTVMVLNLMGYRDYGIDGTLDLMIPDTTVFDWFAWDPYWFTSTRFVNVAKWVNDSQGAWPGVYAWGMAHPVVSTKPFMLGEWGINNNQGQYAGFPSTDGFDQATEAARYRDIAAAFEASFPNIKAINHWHGETLGDKNRNYQMFDRPTAQAGFRDLATDPYFNLAKLSSIPA